MFRQRGLVVHIDEFIAYLNNTLDRLMGQKKGASSSSGMSEVDKSIEITNLMLQEAHKKRINGEKEVEPAIMYNNYGQAVPTQFMPPQQQVNQQYMQPQQYYQQPAMVPMMGVPQPSQYQTGVMHQQMPPRNIYSSQPMSGISSVGLGAPIVTNASRQDPVKVDTTTGRYDRQQRLNLGAQPAPVTDTQVSTPAPATPAPSKPVVYETMLLTAPGIKAREFKDELADKTVISYVAKGNEESPAEWVDGNYTINGWNPDEVKDSIADISIETIKTDYKPMIFAYATDRKIIASKSGLNELSNLKKFTSLDELVTILNNIGNADTEFKNELNRIITKYLNETLDKMGGCRKVIDSFVGDYAELKEIIDNITDRATYNVLEGSLSIVLNWFKNMVSIADTGNQTGEMTVAKIRYIKYVLALNHSHQLVRQIANLGPGYYRLTPESYPSLYNLVAAVKIDDQPSLGKVFYILAGAKLIEVRSVIGNNVYTVTVK